MSQTLANSTNQQLLFREQLLSIHHHTTIIIHVCINLALEIVAADGA